MARKDINKRFRQLIWAFVFLFFNLVLGSVGYILIEDYSVIDAFYMASLIVSTVGFGEVQPLSNAGKVFSSIYLIINISLFAYVVAVLSKYLYEGELKDIFTKYMLGRQVNKLENHVIVCGLGRNGYRAAMELKREKVPFVVIENDVSVLNRAFGEDNKDYYYIIGDATDENTLLSAGIKRAKALMACIPKDSTNVFVTLTARELNPGLKIIARAILNNAESKLRTAGADFVVNPDEIGGNYMATLVNKPEIIEFLSMLMGDGGDNERVRLAEYSYDEYKPQFKGKSLSELGELMNSRISCICHKSKKYGYIFNPKGDAVMHEGDYMIILGSPEEMESFKDLFLNSSSQLT